MRHRLIRVALASAAALGLAVATAPAVHADPMAPAAAKCPKGHLCLFEGPHQSGRILLDEDAHIKKDGFNLRELADIKPPIFPRSAHNPLPDDSGCIIRLNDAPNFGGDEQELVGFGNHELDGRRVASLTSDCG